MRLNRICSENVFFDKRCNELEVWLKERGYSEKSVREQILKARKLSRSEVLNKRKSVGNNNRFVFNITYHPARSKLIWNTLTFNTWQKNGKVFERIPIVGLRRAKNLKDILVRAKVAPLEKKKDSCRSCGGSRCEICKHVVTTEIFRSFSIFFLFFHVRSNTQDYCKFPI